MLLRVCLMVFSLQYQSLSKTGNYRITFIESFVCVSEAVRVQGLVFN